MKYFLDTNICVYFIKGMYPSLKERLFSHQPEEIKIPSIVKAELLYGAKKSKQPEKNLEIITRFLMPFEIIPFSDSSVEPYASIRANLEVKGQIIGPNDLFIAATVLGENGILVTNNIKEFSRVEGLNTENWIK